MVGLFISPVHDPTDHPLSNTAGNGAK